MPVMQNHRMGSARAGALVIATAALVLSACGSRQTGSQPLTFGYVPASLEYPYNVSTANGFTEAAAAAGVKTVVLDPRGSVANQANAIDDLLTQHVNAIGFLPLDSVVAESFVDRIKEKNIPVVAIALQVGDSAKRKIDDPYPGLSALVVTDNYKASLESGKMAAGVLPKGRTAKIAIVMGDPAYAIVRMNNEGFRAALDQAHADYQVVAEQPTKWTPDEGEAVCQNFLTAHPQLDLIFSHADDMAIGCARAIDAANARTRVKLIATGGGSRLGYEAIRSGEIYGSICTRPKLLGELMFKAMYEAATNPNTRSGRYVTYDMPAITKDTLESCPERW